MILCLDIGNSHIFGGLFDDQELKLTFRKPTRDNTSSDELGLFFRSVLRENGFANVTVDGAKRIYAIDATPLSEVDAWLSQFRQYWGPRLDALATEVARGKRKRKNKAK